MVTASDLHGVMGMMPAFATPDAGDIRATATIDVDNLKTGVDRIINDGIDIITAVLGLFVLLFVPESPRWLAQRRRQPTAESAVSTLSIVFRRPYLRLTIIGILLGTVPLLGGWGTNNWLISWADQVGEGLEDATLKARTIWIGSTGAVIGSLFGGWLADAFGRRKTYFVVSLGSLLLSGVIFWTLSPDDGIVFLAAVFLLRLVATIYFGWLPLYLPELFPTAIRSTGTGVAFNFGRILTAVGVLGTLALVELFASDYAKVGQITHLIFAFGMLVILFAPETSGREMDD